MALKRLYKELQEIEKTPVPGCSVRSVADDLFKWKVLIEGPEGTPYENGFFILDVQFPSDYPFNPPKVSFATEIWHAHFPKGHLFLGPRQWEPGRSMHLVLSYITEAMVDPARPILTATKASDGEFSDATPRRCSSDGELFVSVQAGMMTHEFNAARKNIIADVKGECHHLCCIGPTWLTATKISYIGSKKGCTASMGRELEDFRALSDYSDFFEDDGKTLKLLLTARLTGYEAPSETPAGIELEQDATVYLEKARSCTQEHARADQLEDQVMLTVHAQLSDGKDVLLKCTNMAGDEVASCQFQSGDLLIELQYEIACKLQLFLPQIRLFLPGGASLDPARTVGSLL